jgi:hypothetical protein
MKNMIQTILALGLVAVIATNAHAQRNYTGYIGAFDGTSLLNSSGASSTSYTYQIGTFSYGNVAAGTDWFSWNNAGSNTGFTQLKSGTIGGGLLSLDNDGNVFNFAYTAGTGGQIYTSASIDGDGNPSFGNPLLPYLVLTSAATGGNYLTDTREVLVGQFNAALLGYDPEGIATENYLGLINDAQFFSAVVGGIAGSDGSTVLSSASVPEPSSFSLLVAGGAALAALRRRKA